MREQISSVDLAVLYRIEQQCRLIKSIGANSLHITSKLQEQCKS